MNAVVPQSNDPFEVHDTPEFQRVAALPRRDWEAEAKRNDLYLRMTKVFQAPGGQQTLRLIQASALADAHDARGLFAPIRVGEGKCVVGGTEIFDGVQRRTVEELVGKRFSVLSKDSADKLTYEKATAVLSGRKTCVKLVLANGSAVELSADHPVYTPAGWKQAGLLKTGELVATPRKIPAPSETLSVADAEVVLAAYLLSDGGVSQSATGFTNVTQEVVTEFRRVARYFAKDSGGRQIADPVRLKKGSVKDYGVRGLTAFREKWGLHGLSKEKRLPAAFWSLSNRQVALFLSRFWACDGYTEACGVGVTLASERMVDDLQFLLLRIGVRSTKKHRKARCQTGVFDAWRLTVRGAAALRFLDAVGEIPGKNAAVAKLRNKLESTSRNTNYDVVPVSRGELREICTELGFTGRGSDPSVRVSGRTRAERFLGATNGQYVSRQAFEYFCDIFGYTGKYAALANNDLVWERVESLSKTGVKKVYDLSVPATSCFVGNNIVLHNTLLTFLLPTIITNIKRPVLLLPAGLIEKTWLEFKELRKHWVCHPAYMTRAEFDKAVMSYEILGRDSGKNHLNERLPDLIIADECHNLRNRTAARTRRVERYITFNNTTCFCGLSGTITKRSVRDYWHLMYWALKQNMPLPRIQEEMEKWADVLDERKIDGINRRGPGPLLRFCTPEELEQLQPKRTQRLGVTEQMPDEMYRNKTRIVRTAYQRRLRDTYGVISSSEANLDCSLVLRRLSVDPGHKAALLIENMREEWTTPNGEEIAMPTDLWRHARELACGFWYRWEPPPPDHWRQARKAWNWTVRQILDPQEGIHYARFQHLHLDSPMQVALNIKNGHIDDPLIRGAYQRWEQVRDDYQINVVAEWVADNTLQFCLGWLREHKTGIVWTEHRAFGERLAQMAGTGFCANGGVDANGRPIEDYKGAPVIASVKANHAGRNLQAWHRNLIVTASPTGTLWEQLIGRTHRPGQEADTVYVDWVSACAEQDDGFNQLLADARYIQDTTGQSQKVLYADKI